MKDWTKASLKDDGITEDSEFFEYIGRMRELDGDFSEFLRNSDDNSYIHNKLEEISQLLQLIQEIRYYHFDTLVKTSSDIKLNVPKINNTNYTDAISLIDEIAYTKINQLCTYISAKDIFNINKIIDSLKKPLLNLANMNFAVYERTCQKLGVSISEDCKKDLDDFNLKFKDLEQPPLSAHSSNTYNTAFSHSNEIPYTAGQNTINYQPGYNNVPNVQQMRPNNQPKYNNTPQHPQSQSNNQYAHTNNVPHKQVIMHQTGENRTSVRKRRKKTLTPVELLSLGLATTACIVGISVFASNICNHITTPSPTPQPTQTPHTIVTTAQPTAQPNIIVNIPANTPVNTKAPVVTPTPTNTPNVIKKGTLSYAIQFMDDELISVVANSLRNSIDNYHEWQINMYGNGCNQIFDSDKEYVTYVFSNLDARASCMNLGGPGNTDRFAIAPQMEQLSGDVAKYLIANAIGDSGKYNKSDYSIEDIDFYYSIYGGKTKSFDVRTVKIKNNTLFEDQLVGRTDHFSGYLKGLISAHCTLNAALEGGKKDKLTNANTKCAFGTQEGTVINDASLEAYHALVNLLQGEYELKVNSQGKGIKIEYDKDLEH